MSIESDLLILFQDLQECSDQIGRNSTAFFRSFPFIPPSIGIGDGQVIYMTQKGDGAVLRISQVIRKNSPEYQAAMSEKDIANLVSRSIGELLAEKKDKTATKFDLPEDTTVFKRDLKRHIELRHSQTPANRTHLFGAWVLQSDAIPSIAIGPVRIQLRDVWLEEAVQSHLFTRIRADEISNRWGNAQSKFEKSNDIKDFWDDTVFDAVGPCPWVCTVNVKGHSEQRSKEKAILAARIGLAAIALSWDRPPKRIHESGLLYDFGPRRNRVTFVYCMDKMVSAGHESVMRQGHFLNAADASVFLSDAAARFQTVGDALESFLAVEAAGPIAKLEAMLCRALVWFHEACREPLDFLAIVKFAAALDTLAAGGRARGISELVQYRFPVKDMNAKFLSDGTSAKDLIEEIYSAGRSQLVHGTRPSLIEDFDALRSRAELLTSLTFSACIHWLGEYSGCDDEKALRKP